MSVARSGWANGSFPSTVAVCQTTLKDHRGEGARVEQDTEGIAPQPGAHGFAGKQFLARHTMRGPFRLPPGPDGLSFALRQSVGSELEPGHRVDLVENGEIFSALEREILSARQSIHVLIYIWRPCRASDRLVEALVAKAQQGVAVRVVVDPVGSEEVFGPHDFDQGVEKRLCDAGCEVHYFHLLAGRVLKRLLGREHQKLVVIDGKVGFTGGFGIWEAWEGDGRSPNSWRDTNVRVEGSCVTDLQFSFARAWQESGGALLPDCEFPRERPNAGESRAAFVSSQGALGISDAERMCRLVIAAATQRLWIANAYFTPPNAILEQLEEKRRQGVEIRVLAPGPVHDVPIIRASQRATYERLLKVGVRIWEYQPSMMHAKTMLVDDWLTMVGSTNLDSLSLTRLGEGSLLVADPRLNTQLTRSWERDLAFSKEMTLSNGGRTGPFKRLSRRLTQALGRDR